MTPKNNDPLLSLANGLLVFGMGIVLFVGGVVALAIPSVLIAQDAVLVPLLDKPPEAADLALLLLVLGVILGTLAMLLSALLNLRRIIKSVHEDPFVPENADRLRKMGWLVIGMQAISLPLGLLAKPIEDLSESIHVNSGVSFAAISLALLLFILARVFRHGTALRDDLEGTV